MAKRIYGGHYTQNVQVTRDDGTTDESGNPRAPAKQHLNEVEGAAGLSKPLPNGRRGRAQ